jgi:sulfofructose kinase
MATQCRSTQSTLQLFAEPLQFPDMLAPIGATDILCLGLNSADTIIRLPRFPALDSKVPILSSEVRPGGQAASAAVACQHWGLRTRYAGKIGDDWAGRFQREQMVREGVESRWIEVPGCPSQTAYIIVDIPSGERTVLWQHDPRIGFTNDDLPRDWIAETRLLHVDGHPPGPAALAARLAHEAGAIVTADLDNLYPGVEDLLASVDYLISSREFPLRVTGIADIPEALPDALPGALPVALKYLQRRFGCKLAGATLGRDGVLAWDGASFHYSPAFSIEAIDTTGAGDIFHAAFACALLEGNDIDSVLEFSCAAAALNCTAAGARGGIRPVAEIRKLMREGSRHPAAFDGKQLRATEAAIQRQAPDPSTPSSSNG